MDEAASGGLGFDPTPFLANTPGIVALFCVLLLGFNVWKLYALVNEGNPEKLRAAQALLFASMGFSLTVFLVAVAALIVLDGRKREIALSIYPRDSAFAQLGTNAPAVRIAEKQVAADKIRFTITHPIGLGERVQVDVDFDSYIAWRIQQAREFAVVAQAPSPGLVDPEVN